MISGFEAEELGALINFVKNKDYDINFTPQVNRLFDNPEDFYTLLDTLGIPFRLPLSFMDKHYIHYLVQKDDEEILKNFWVADLVSMYECVYSGVPDGGWTRRRILNKLREYFDNN